MFTCLIGLLAGRAPATDSSYIGPENGRWSKASHWSPARVPDNNAHHTFDVTINNNTATLDIDVTINNFIISGDSLMGFITRDHSLTCSTPQKTAGPVMGLPFRL